MPRQRGFTLLELIITVAIIGVVMAIGSGTGMFSWKRDKTTLNTARELQNALATLRDNAQARNTTSRMVITLSGSTYTMTTTYSSAPTTTCSSAGTWTTIETKDIEVDSNYTIAGTAYTDSICFYRDGSSNGGNFTIAPNSGVTGSTYTLDIYVATGYVDVDKS